MAKVKVTSPFYDKFDLFRLYQPGEVIVVDETRAADIEARSLGQWLDKPAPETPETEPEPEPSRKEEPKAKAKKPKKQ